MKRSSMLVVLLVVTTAFSLDAGDIEQEQEGDDDGRYNQKIELEAVAPSKNLFPEPLPGALQKFDPIVKEKADEDGEQTAISSAASSRTFSYPQKANEDDTQEVSVAATNSTTILLSSGSENQGLGILLIVVLILNILAVAMVARIPSQQDRSAKIAKGIVFLLLSISIIISIVMKIAFSS